MQFNSKIYVGSNDVFVNGSNAHMVCMKKRMQMGI